MQIIKWLSLQLSRLTVVEDEIPAHLRTEAKERRQRLIGTK